MRLRACQLTCSLLIACGHSAPPPATTATIGPLGGVVQVPGGPALNIVPGALSAETTISVQARTSAPSGALSTVYDFGPAGLTLARAATLAIPVDPSVTEASIYLNAGSAFQSVPAMVKNGVVSTEITQLSSNYAGPSQKGTRTVSGTIPGRAARRPDRASPRE